MNRQASGCIALVAVLVAVGLLSLLLLFRAIVPGGPLGWDEAFHVLWSQRIAADLRSGDLIGLLYDSYRQVYWPPAFTWLLGPVLALTGPSDTVARGIGVLSLCWLAIWLYLGGHAIAPGGRYAAVAGVAAAACGMLAGAVLVWAPSAMLDVPAMAMLAGGLWGYFALLGRARPPAAGYAALGLWIGLTFLMKQNYGVLLGLAVGGSMLFDGQWYRLRPGAEAGARRRGHLAAAAVLAVFLLGWFAYPQKFFQTVQSLRNSPWGPDASSLDGILFFPRLMPWLAGSWPLLVVWLGVFLASLRPSCFRDGRTRALILLILFQAAFAELSTTKIDRHIMPFIPAFALLTGYWLARLLATPQRGIRWAVAGAAVLLLLVHSAFVLPATGPVTAPPGTQLLHAIAAAVAREPVLYVGTRDLVASPATVDWRLIAEDAMNVDGAGALIYASEVRFAQDTLGKLPGFLQGPLRTLVERWPGRERAYSLHAGMPLDAPDVELRSENFRAQIAAALSRRPVDRIVVVLMPRGADRPDVNPAQAAADLAALGFQPDGPAQTVEGADIRSFRRAVTVN